MSNQFFPKLSWRLQRLNKLIKGSGFYQIRVNAELVSAVDVFLNRRRTHDNNRQDLQPIMAVTADPFQNLQTVFLGHLDVEESECRKREVLTIREWPYALQVINCLLTIPYDHDGVANVRPKQS